jgi:cyclophilin family peptidyl-prolyl cis-trans isomerase
MYIHFVLFFFTLACPHTHTHTHTPPQVLDNKAQGASYDFSTVWRVQQDSCIDFGRVVGGGGKKLQKNINESGYMRIASENAAAWTSNTEVNDLRHTEPYLLTMKRGGGTYEFSVTLRANAELDKDHVVFGQLLMGEGEEMKRSNEEVVKEILKVKVGLWVCVREGVCVCV